MMKCVLSKEELLKPLLSVVSIADKKHTNPILSFILCEVKGNKLFLKASDMEAEVLATIELTSNIRQDGKVTLPARKVTEIIRNLPDDVEIEIFQHKTNRVVIKSNKSRFILSSLDPKNFPEMKEDTGKSMFKMPQHRLAEVVKRVQFAMANNDSRYFLNGMLWEISGESFKAVATDGHRMAQSELTIENTYLDCTQMIVPKKAINEIQKLISVHDEGDIEIQIGKNYFKLSLPNYQFTSKLIDGRYPDYTRVIPENNDRILVANRMQLKQALLRTSILSNEQYRGVRLTLDQNNLMLSANNPEYEEAQDQIEVNYNDQPMEIGFNVGYLLDSVNVLDAEKVDLCFDTPRMGVLIKDDTTKSLYVISPIRL